MFCPAVFAAIIPVHAKQLSRVPVDAVNFPVVRIGIVELPANVIDVASEVIDKLPAVFKHFVVEAQKIYCTPTAVALVRVAFLPFKVFTISNPSTFNIDEPVILTCPTTAIEQLSFTFGMACPVAFGFIVSISR